MKQLVIGNLVVTLALGVGLLWQSQRIAALEGELGDVASTAETLKVARASTPEGRVEARPERERERARDRSGDFEGYDEPAKGAAASRDDVAEVVDEVVDDRVDEAVERRLEEKKQEGRTKWVSQASEMLRYEVQKRVGSDVPPEKVDEAMAYLDDILYETLDLQQGLESGTMTVPEVMERSDTALRELRQNLNGVLGEDATTDLGPVIRPGQGWPQD